jgi:hypothetical protein
VTTTFTLSDTSTAYASATTDSTTTVIDSDPRSGPSEPFTWTGAGDGTTWTAASNWSDSGYYPGQFSNADQVIITPSGSIVVSYDSTETIDSLTTNSNATLDITGGSLTIGGIGSDIAGTLNLSGGTLDIAAAVSVANLTLDNQSSANSGLSGTTLTVTDSLTWDAASTAYAAIDLASAATATVTNSVYLDATFTVDGQLNVDGNMTLGSGYPGGSPAAKGIVEINSDGTVAIGAGDGIGFSFGTPGGYVDNFGLLVGDGSGANITVAVTNEVSGIIEAQYGTFSLSDGLSNAGIVEVNGALDLSGTLAGSGQIYIGNGGSLSLASLGATGAMTNAIDFLGNGTLTFGSNTLDSSHNLDQAITGFNSSDSIVYDGTVTDAVYNSTGSGVGTLTLSNGGSTVAILTLDGDYSDATFTPTSGVGSTQIAVNHASDGFYNTNVNWDSTDSWGNVTPPSSVDDATFDYPGSGPYQVTIQSSTTAYADAVTIGASGATVVDEGTLLLTGGLTVNSGAFELAGGTLQTPSITTGAGGFSGYGTVEGAVDVTGPIAASSATALDFTGPVSGTGSFNIETNATLEFDSAVGSGTTVTFEGGTGTLDLTQPEKFTATIQGFTGTAANAQHSDVIDLAGISYNSGSFSESYNGSTGVLTVSDGTNTASLTFIDFTGTFKFAADGSGGTEIYDPPASGSSVTVGGDHFFFHENPGANSGGTNTQGGSSEHEHFAGMHAEELASLTSAVTPPNGGIADMAHHHTDSITIPGVNTSYLQQHLQSLAHLT